MLLRIYIPKSSSRPLSVNVRTDHSLTLFSSNPETFMDFHKSQSIINCYTEGVFISARYSALRKCWILLWLTCSRFHICKPCVEKCVKLTCHRCWFLFRVKRTVWVLMETSGFSTRESQKGSAHLSGQTCGWATHTVKAAVVYLGVDALYGFVESLW